MDEPTYRAMTYDLTLHFAKTLADANPDMTFCYVSGSGTDSTEKGRLMWARVKGKTENDLLKLPFKQAYMFRPGYIQPTKGLKNTIKAYHYISWLYPVLKTLFPKAACSLQEIGLAMISVTNTGYNKHVLEVPDIVKAAKALQ
jgi:hypothetical protein